MHSEQFKRQIATVINQGVAQNLTFVEMAKMITTITSEQLYNAYRIARTEGARVCADAKLQAMRQAQNQGADIKKEWNSALSSTTRDGHAAMHGQIREVDEFFDHPDGYQALRPLGFGIAKEDIHCLCLLLQRATWALSEEERLERLTEIEEWASARNFIEYNQKFIDGG